MNVERFAYNKRARGITTETRKLILHVECATTYGGSVRCLENFLKYCARDEYRHVVYLYTPFIGNEQLSRYCDDVIIAPQVQSPKRVGKFSRLIHVLSLAYRHAVGLCAYLKKHEVSLIRLNNGPTAHLGALIAARLLQKPVVSWLRSMPRNIKLTPIERWCMRVPKKLVAVSNAVRDAYVFAGIPAESIVTLYDGTEVPDTASVAQKNAVPFKIGVLGRLVAWKGLSDIVEAAAILRHKKVVFEIAGEEDASEPGFKEKLQKAIAEKGLGEKVVLCGFLKDPQGFLSSIDCLLNPSFPAEPFGMSIIEAMARGKTVIATKSGGPLEIVEQGRTGLLVTPRSQQEIADAILELIDNPDRTREMGEAARERVRSHFEVKERVREQEHLLRSSIENGRA